jgi:uncharacterized protein
MQRARDFFAKVSLAVALAAIPTLATAQAQPLAGSGRQATYDQLRHQIADIPAFDNHGHPGLPEDSDVDAMQIPADSSLPLRLRAENPEFVAAAQALFHYPYSDLSPEHAAVLVQEKQRLRQSLGDRYFSHILDQVGIETAVANRVAMPSYLEPSRFLWVFFLDPLLFPLNNEGFASKNPDLKLNLPLEEKLRQRYLSEVGLNRVPDGFADYLAIMSRILQMKRTAGAVGTKFEIAYFRPLRFSDPTRETAERIYRKYVHGGVVPDSDYSELQDFLFRYLLEESGRLHLPVQIHTAVGGGDYFNLTGGNIMNLENILRDPRFENVTFVLLHGGFPQEREAIWLAARKNVYLDSSLMELFLYPEEFKHSLRLWLETFPEKVVFGSDTFPISDVTGAEEFYWLAAESTRSALAGALAEMIAEKEITEAQALALARGYLHDNAAHLYRH